VTLNEKYVWVLGLFGIFSLFQDGML